MACTLQTHQNSSAKGESKLECRGWAHTDTHTNICFSVVRNSETRQAQQRQLACRRARYCAYEAAKSASGSRGPKGLLASSSPSSCSAALRTSDDLSSRRPVTLTFGPVVMYALCPRQEAQSACRQAG